MNTLYFESLTAMLSANPGLCGFVTHLIVACYLLWKHVPLPRTRLFIIITVDILLLYSDLLKLCKQQ